MSFKKAIMAATATMMIGAGQTLAAPVGWTEISGSAPCHVMSNCTPGWIVEEWSFMVPESATGGATTFWLDFSYWAYDFDAGEEANSLYLHDLSRFVALDEFMKIPVGGWNGWENVSEPWYLLALNFEPSLEKHIETAGLYAPPAPVPLPAGVALLPVGVGAFALLRRRSTKARAAD